MSTTLIVFSPGASSDDAERLVVGARHAITADLIARARQIDLIDRIIVATDSRALVDTLRFFDVIADYDDPTIAFSFGSRLAQIVERYGVQKAFYIGGGAGALLRLDEMRQIAEQLHASESVLIPNNYWSSDFVAFAPGSAAIDLPPIDTDNNLAYLLRTERNLPYVAQPRTVGTQFDVDTPTDVLLLSYAAELGSYCKAYLKQIQLQMAPLERLLPHLTRRESELFVFGRVASEVWRYFETQVACRTRLLSEERGLVASGREIRGEARSLLGFLFEKYGTRQAFELLGEICTATLIDTRVLLAHRKIRASAHDRFNADLFRPGQIHDPWLREFTEAAMNAPVPVVLGGHTLVCGGLYLLVDGAWRDFPPNSR